MCWTWFWADHPENLSVGRGTGRQVGGPCGVARSAPLCQGLGQKHCRLDREPARPVQSGRVKRRT